MAQQPEKKITKKISSWKQKTAYRILAPESFNSKEIGVTLANSPENLVGRGMGISVKDLMDDKSKQHMKIVFEIYRSEGDKAFTRFKAFNISSGYLRSRAQKGTSKVSCIDFIDTDMGRVKIKTMITTHKRTTSTNKASMIKGVSEVLSGKKRKLDSFVQALLAGKVGTELYKSIKNICPVRRVEIYSIERV